MKPSQEEIAKILGVTLPWVAKYDREYPYVRRTYGDWKERFYGYNVWGFKDETWRKLIEPGDPSFQDRAL